ncbi:glycoside hydrolase family 16 protein [Hymenobacter rubidus]|uniref:glycoside hydrolase family 16 protein n=1 Tax=Hymenobacter rubidus TaxID=1441626 RepID=UPI00191EC346|nr:family 16 glycosylhydrolase [Hymenobacter rubidus]
MDLLLYYLTPSIRRRITKPVQALLFIGLMWLAAAPSTLAQHRINYTDWRLEWAEEFNTPLDTALLAQRWRFAFPWGRSQTSPIDDGYSTAETLHQGNGVLNMTMERRRAPRPYRGKLLHYDTPMLMSRHPADSLRPQNCNPTDDGFSYGLFEARVRQPKSDAAASGFWLYGGAPDEVDIFETNANVLTNNVHLLPGNYWRPSRREDLTSQSKFYNTDPAGNLHEQFHTYGVSWLPNEITFYFDGVPIRRETRFVPAGCTMSLILNIAALAWAREEADTMVVDYIRVYRPRRLPTVPVVQRPSGNFPQTELAWLPAEEAPGRPDQATHQTWQLAAESRQPHRLTLLLTDNYNPPRDLALPLPIAGRWAPAWHQNGGTPELKVQVAAPDSVHWTVCDVRGAPVAAGVAPGGGTWQPRWALLAAGAYALHLQQGMARAVHPLIIIERPANSKPTAEWQESAPVAPNPD